MIEYIFFDSSLSERFSKHARSLGIECIPTQDSMGITLAVPEDIPDDVAAALELAYDELLEQQAEMIEADEAELKHAAAIHINLADGSPCMIRIEPAMMNRLLSCLSIDELHRLVTGIAHDVENPSSRPLCHNSSE